MNDLFRLEDDAPARRALYLAAIILIAIPFVQALSQPQFWPMQLGNINWRIGVANFLSGILILPFLGLVVLLVLGRALASRTVLRTVAVVCFVLAFGLIASTILYAFDALQFRSIVNSQQMSQFNLMVVRVAISSVIFGITFAYMGLIAFRVPKTAKTPAKRGNVKQADEGVGLIVGR